MLRAIQLDDQLVFRTGEVSDVAGNRQLPPKLQTHQPMRSKLPPKPRLGLRMSRRSLLAFALSFGEIVRLGTVPPSVGYADISPQRVESDLKRSSKLHDHIIDTARLAPGFASTFETLARFSALSSFSIFIAFDDRERLASALRRPPSPELRL